MARELILLPRFKRDYRSARKHPEFDRETLEYIFDVLISGTKPPEPFQEHRLGKRALNLAGFAECHLGADLLLIYRSPQRGSPLSNRHASAAIRDQRASHTSLDATPRKGAALAGYLSLGPVSATFGHYWPATRCHKGVSRNIVLGVII